MRALAEMDANLIIARLEKLLSDKAWLGICGSRRISRGSVATRASPRDFKWGGSPSSYQSLAEGVPVLGICSNLDQFLAMGRVEKAEAGLPFAGRNGNCVQDTCCG